MRAMFLKSTLQKIKDIKPENSLAELARKEKKTDKKLQKILSDKKEPLWIPSLRSFKIILLWVILGYILVHPGIINWALSFFPKSLTSHELFLCIRESILSILGVIPQININDNHYQNLIAIHAGIGAVLVGLAFFVAQSLIDKNDPEKGRILLYKSHFFPLLTAEILVFFVFLWGNVNLIGGILVIGVLALFTIYYLGSTIKILIKDHEMEDAKKEMFFGVLKRNFIRILDFEVEKRLGGNLLHEKGKIIEKSTAGLVKISPFGAFGDKSYLELKIDQKGYVTDISFTALNKLTKFIERLAQESTKNSRNFGAIHEIQPNEGIEKRSPVAYIITRFLEYSEDGEVLHIKEDIFSSDSSKKEDEIRQIKKLARETFTIKEIEDISKEARFELSKIKDRYIKAIKKEEIGELEKLEDIYNDLAKEFTGFMQLYGGGFSPKQAEDERSSFLGKLKPVEWLYRDIRDVFSLAMTEGSFNVVKEVEFLPIRLAKVGIEKGDHLIFQDFIRLHKNLYYYAFSRKDKDEQITNLMNDRTWRYLKELSDYTLDSKFERQEITENDYVGYYTHIIFVFQSLIKEAFDNRDFENFKIFVNKFNSLFERLDRYKPRSYEKNETLEKLEQKQNEVIYGLSSWILYKYRGDETIKPYYDKIKNYLPSDIEDLTRLFLRVHDFDQEEGWGWSYWEWEGREDVIIINILEKLEVMYAVHGLTQLQSKNEEQIEKIELDHSRDLAYLADGTRDLIKTFNSIQSTSENWKPILTDNAIVKVDSFKQLLNKAKIAQENDELIKKRGTRISTEKVEQFKENVVKNFYDSQGIRNILSFYDLYEDQSGKAYNGKLEKLGINTMFDKAGFFDDSVSWHVLFMGFEQGFEFGQSMVRGENSQVIKALKEKLISTKKQSFDTSLEKFSPNEVIIVSLNGASWRFFEEDRKSKNYIPEWQIEKSKEYPSEIAGLYKLGEAEIPVYEIYDDTKSRGILVLNRSFLGKLIQYNPLNKGDNKGLKKDIFHMSVEEFTDDSDSMKDFLTNTPAWLEDIVDTDKQKDHLKERVLIKIFERFEFEIDENIEGFYIEIPDVEN